MVLCVWRFTANAAAACIALAALANADGSEEGSLPPDNSCHVNHACPAATCADARANYGATEDGLYTLSLEVDAVEIATYVASMAQGCGIRDNNDPASWPTRLGASYQGAGGYSPNSRKCVVPTALLNDDYLKVIRTDKKVWCHMMGKGPKDAGETPRAYVDVDPGSNKAQFQYGLTMFTTTFSKLRFNERTQLIYTADYTFADTTQERTDGSAGEGLNPCDTACASQGSASILKKNCDTTGADGTFHVPFGTAGACFSFGDGGCAMEAIPDTVTEATPTMQYDLSASGLYVNQYKHTAGMGGGRVQGTDFAGSTFFKLQYLSEKELNAQGGLQDGAEQLNVWYDDRVNEDDDDTRPTLVGEYGSRSLKFENPSNEASASCMVAGPDVGHTKQYVANLLDKGREISAAYTVGVGIGGWGFPICLEKTDFFDANVYVDTSSDPSVFEEYVPINCVTADNVQDTKAEVNFQTNSFTMVRNPNVNYATGRTRPHDTKDYGYVQHFYDESTRTICDSATEDTTFEPGPADAAKDRVCTPKVTTTSTTTTTPTTTGEDDYDAGSPDDESTTPMTTTPTTVGENVPTDGPPNDIDTAINKMDSKLVQILAIAGSSVLAIIILVIIACCCCCGRRNQQGGAQAASQKAPAARQSNPAFGSSA